MAYCTVPYKVTKTRKITHFKIYGMLFFLGGVFLRSAIDSKGPGPGPSPGPGAKHGPTLGLGQGGACHIAYAGV